VIDAYDLQRICLLGQLRLIEEACGRVCTVFAGAISGCRYVHGAFASAYNMALIDQFSTDPWKSPNFAEGMPKMKKFYDTYIAKFFTPKGQQAQEAESGPS
jgi:hypothetical protein